LELGDEVVALMVGGGQQFAAFFHLVKTMHAGGGGSSETPFNPSQYVAEMEYCFLELS